MPTEFQQTPGSGHLGGDSSVRQSGTTRWAQVVSASVVVVVLAGMTTAGQAESAPLPIVEHSPAEASVSYLAGDFCLPGNTADDLDSMFDSEPGGVIGADYQRATRLPNGNVLWTFQDAEIRLPTGRSTIVHNIGMMQIATCFSVLMSGTRAKPEPWLFASETTPFQHWYWPMDAAMGSDGGVYVYLVEMFERGTRYLDHVVPTSTAVAAIDIETWNVEFLGSAGDDSSDLYGWSSESDEEWTYLYAHCYRQFGYDLGPNGFFRIHDLDCADELRVARVPRGELFAPYEYWTGGGWSRHRWQARPILETEGRLVNAADISYIEGQWLAIVKIDDWFGSEILVESSSRPTGPFQTVAVIGATPQCDPGICNTYFASVIPGGDDGEIIIGLSNNRWDGVLSPVYRPTFRTIVAPTHRIARPNRCAIGQCR